MSGTGHALALQGLTKRYGSFTAVADVSLRVERGEFIQLQKTKADSPKSWSVDIADIDKATWDLSVKNPDSGEETIHRSPADIMKEIAELDSESARVLGKIKALL